METTKLLQCWRDFFYDLLIGTIKRFFLYAILGGCIGLSSWWLLKNFAIAGHDFSSWLLYAILAVTFLWYVFFGTLHGIAFSIFLSGGSKLSHMVEGVQGLLDHLAKNVIERLPKINKNIPRDQWEKKFDEIGKEFLQKLKLKRGLMAMAGSFIFAMVLKSLKFFFLDDVVLKLKEKNENSLSSADVENAVRRVGVEKILEPVSDSILTLHFLNAALMLISLGLPIALFLWL